MNTMKLKTWVLVGMTSLMMLSATMAEAGEPYISDIIQAKVDKVSVGGKSVVINGKQYKVMIDQKLSSYRAKEDLQQSVDLRDLKNGETYYFNIVARGQAAKAKNMNEVVFISTQLPLE